MKLKHHGSIITCDSICTFGKTSIAWWQEAKIVEMSRADHGKVNHNTGLGYPNIYKQSDKIRFVFKDET